MQLFPCPFCGPRAETEFHFGGEAGKIRPEPAGESRPTAWTDYLYATPTRRARRARSGCISTCGEFFVAGARHRHACGHRRRSRSRSDSAMSARAHRRRRSTAGADRLPLRRARLSGRAGDTIASALLANGVRIVGRSFKYHRPRGIFGAGAEEPNAIVDVDVGGKRDARTCGRRRWTLVDGMTFAPANAWPDVRPRSGRRSSTASRVSCRPASTTRPSSGRTGATYRTAHPRTGRPRPARSCNEPPADCPQIDARCDVLVVGGGPAGLAAARAAARTGEARHPGRRSTEAGRLAAASRRRRSKASHGARLGRPSVVAELRPTAHRVAPRTPRPTASISIISSALWRAARASARRRALAHARRRIVVAAGAIERPLVFPDNDRPGVMSAEAALVYLKRHTRCCVGERVVVATNNDSAYAIATALRRAGAEVTCRRSARRRTRPSAPERVDVPAPASASIARACGRKCVEAVDAIARRARSKPIALLVSGGLYADRASLRQARASCATTRRRRLRAGRAASTASASSARPRAFDLAPRSPSPAAGGGAASAGADGARRPYRIEPPGRSPARGPQWIDFQNDVTVKDIELAARENFRSVEHLKRYTTLGMATDQGKTSNLNGLAALAALTGRTIERDGHHHLPPALHAGAARRRSRGGGAASCSIPCARLALEPQHRATGAIFREYGGWLRPACYGEGDADADDPARGAARTRDGRRCSTARRSARSKCLGPGGALIDFNSYNEISTLKPGRIRYGFMLTETRHRL